MSGNSPYPPTSGNTVSVDAKRLWGGGVATAGVAALVAVVGVLVCTGVLGIDVETPALVIGVSGSFMFDYGFTAFVLALVATGLAQALSLSTPRPQAFFGWIVGLVTLLVVVLPFARGGDLAGQISAAVINLVIGLAIGSLLSAVLARTVFDNERSWQQPRP